MSRARAIAAAIAARDVERGPRLRPGDHRPGRPRGGEVPVLGKPERALQGERDQRRGAAASSGLSDLRALPECGRRRDARRGDAPRMERGHAVRWSAGLHRLQSPVQRNDDTGRARKRRDEPDRLPDRLVQQHGRRPAERRLPGHRGRMRGQVQLLGARRERHHRPHHHHLRHQHRRDPRRRHRVSRLGRQHAGERLLHDLRELALLRQSALRPGELHLGGRGQRGAARGRARGRARPHLLLPGAAQQLHAQLGDAAHHPVGHDAPDARRGRCARASAPSTRAARRP